MRRYSVEIKIIVLITFAVITVFAAGILAYNSINFVLTTIKKEAQPNYSLLILKEISNSVQRGEGYVEYYTLTSNRKYLKPYRKVIKTIEYGLDSLEVYSKGNKIREAQIDTIGILMDQKFRAWSLMLKQRNDDRVEDALTKLSNVLEVATDTVTLQVPQSVTVEIPDTVANGAINNAEEKPGFFARLFKKKPEVIEISQPKIDSVIVEEIIESKDTSIAVGVDKTTIQTEIVRLKEQEEKDLKKSMAFEVTLKQRNNQITNQLETLITKIEQDELEALKQKAIEADRMVEITNRWSLLFLLLFCNLLIGVVYVVQRYIRKSNATQVALTNAKNAALKLSQTKQQFLANMSHEIRTPMNAIVGFTDQILQMHLEKQSREQLEIVKRSADHLLNIINDILDYSKLEAGKVSIDKHAFDIRDLFYQAFQLYKPSADLKKIKFNVHYEPGSPDVLIGDSFRLSQIIFNLLSNAIKFTDDGKVEVKAKAQKQGKNDVILSVEVKDSGIGIPKEKLKSIFEEFTQADITTSRSYGGTGLGLAIVSKLVNLHHGKIYVENTKGGGACFKVEIKYKIGKKEDLKAKTVTKETKNLDLAGYTILVADDDEYNRKLIGHILEKWKVQFKVVSNGADVVSLLQKEDYNMLLLDIHMPGMNGYDVAKHIRTSKEIKNRKIPIIALTAAVAKEDIKKAKESGINSVLSKPYTEVDLSGKIIEHLKITKLKKQETGKEQITTIEQPIVKSNNSDFQELYELANNDRGFVEDMLKMFVKNTEEDMLEMDSSHKSKNWIELAELAHKIKAPCKHLDASELGDLLKQLELKAREGASISLIEDLYKRTRKDVDLLLVKVNKHLKSNFT